ncbi:unnamed protein product, partial [Prorocentrum cordatum]
SSLCTRRVACPAPDTSRTLCKGLGMFSALGLWDETEEQETPRHDKPLQTERAHSARRNPDTDAAYERAAPSQPSESASLVTEGWNAIQTVWETVSKASASLGEAFDLGAADESAPPATSPEEPRASRCRALSTPPALRASTPRAASAAPWTPRRPAGALPQEAGAKGPCVPGGQLRLMIIGLAQPRSARGGAAVPLACGGAGKSPRWEGPTPLLFAGLTPEYQESPKPSGAVRESEQARRVQWRKTASCLSSGGTRSYEETSDRVQRPARRTDRRCRGSRRERSCVHVVHVDSSRPPASWLL